MDFYSQNSDSMIEQYNQLLPERVHSSWLDYLPKYPGQALDIGAGKGRDAHWLASKGWLVTAIEPRADLRSEIPQRPNIIALDDELPALPSTPRQKYELILVSAVWTHLTPRQQQIAFNRLQQLLAPDAILVITWRNQAYNRQRKCQPVDEQVFESGNHVQKLGIVETADDKGREGVTWKCAVLRATVNEFV